MGKPKAGMAPRRERFVAEYLIDQNATQAAIRAGYSKKTAHVCGPQLLANPSVADAISKGRAKLAERTEWTQGKVIAELACIAQSDLGDIMDFSGDDVRMRLANEIPKSARRAISSIKVRRYVEGRGEDARTVEVVEFKLWDKAKALDDISRHLGFYPPTRTENTNADLDQFSEDELIRLERGESLMAVYAARRRRGEESEKGEPHGSDRQGS